MHDFGGFNYRCHTCGQGWHISRTDEFNKREPRFCPICGHSGKLTRSNNVMGTAEAECFTKSDIKRRLLELLYQIWRGNPDKLANMPDRFVDYVKQELED